MRKKRVFQQLPVHISHDKVLRGVMPYHTCEDIMVRSEATGGTREQKRERRLEIFLKNLHHDDAPFRWGAAEALGKMGDERAVEPLILVLEDEDWRVRLKAAWSLGQLGDMRALPHLRRLMRDEKEEVQDIAKEAVQSIHRRLLRASGEGNR